MNEDNNRHTRPGQGDAFKTATEVAFLVQDAKFTGFVHNYTLKGKFIIPSLVPLMKSSSAINESGTTSITSNNTGRTYSGKYKRTNYVSISIPMNIAMRFMKRCSIRHFTIRPMDTNLYIQIVIPKNTEFILNFVGEDINKIRIVGVNENSLYSNGSASIGDLDDEF